MLEAKPTCQSSCVFLPATAIFERDKSRAWFHPPVLTRLPLDMSGLDCLLPPTLFLRRLLETTYLIPINNTS